MAYSYKGINTEGIKAAQKSVDNYVDTTEKYLNRIKSPNVSAAFKGRYSVAVQEFINAVIEEVKVPLNELRSYKEDLQVAKENYMSMDQTVQSSVNSSQK